MFVPPRSRKRHLIIGLGIQCMFIVLKLAEMRIAYVGVILFQAMYMYILGRLVLTKAQQEPQFPYAVHLFLLPTLSEWRQAISYCAV